MFPSNYLETYWPHKLDTIATCVFPGHCLTNHTKMIAAFVLSFDMGLESLFL